MTENALTGRPFTLANLAISPGSSTLQSLTHYVRILTRLAGAYIMNEEERLRAIRSSDFFAGLSDQATAALAVMGQSAVHLAGDELFREFDKAKDVYLIVEGKIALAICLPEVGCRQLDQLGPGEIIGWSPLLGRLRLSDTARAISDSRVIAFDGQELLTLCREDPSFGVEFMLQTAKVLAARLVATRLSLMDQCGKRLPLDTVLESD